MTNLSTSYIQNGAANALARIGEPAIPSLVAKLGDWKMGQRIAEVLKVLGWQPLSEQEKIQYEAALKNRRDKLPVGHEFSQATIPDAIEKILD